VIFTAPLVLLGLAVLPGLYLLLRLTPPASRRVVFPPLMLLRGLAAQERTPARMPLWLLLLRLVIAALVIIGLAGPGLHPPPSLPGAGPVLLVVDNGFAAAADWQARRDEMLDIAAAAARAGRAVGILATARGADGAAPMVAGLMPGLQARAVVSAMQPEPWPVDRVAAAAALRAAPEASVIYLADGITDGGGFEGFMAAANPARIYSNGMAARLIADPMLAADGDLTVRLVAGPADAAVLAETVNGDVLGRAGFANGVARLALPVALRARVKKLVLAGPPSASGTLLLDGSAQAGVVGLLAGEGDAETPYLGPLFYLRRGLPAGTEVVSGSLSAVLADRPGVVIAADAPLGANDLAAAQDFINGGGVLVRFAGPLTAASPDGLSPDPLLAGDRRLGGALTWSSPQGLAAFPAGSPFAGLKLDAGVSVSRQSLADPAQLDLGTVWASLADGTPLVLGRAQGRGFLVSVLTSANSDWSNLALSGLYPAMLSRLVGLSEGAPPKPDSALALQSGLDGFGNLSAAANVASLRAEDVSRLMVSPSHPPGLYGAGGASLALNVGGHVAPLQAASLPGAVAFGNAPAPVDLGPYLLAASVVLLAVDLLLSLRLRGLLRLALPVSLLIWSGDFARAENPALSTSLAYVITGDAAVDQISADGLGYLSVATSAHSSAQLGTPSGVRPGVDDISLYPLVYWPVLAGAAPPDAAACAALRSYMQHGGLLVIDTQGGDADDAGSGAGFAVGAQSALQRDVACLDLAPMEALTPADVLAHCFYIIQEFPGKFAGGPVWIATAAARDADGVSPVIVGGNDWAGAWARDAYGNPEQTPLPDGEAQRVTADRFGTNLVIYALTGSYKADQAALPELLNHLSAP
jgi:hypothetical protein